MSVDAFIPEVWNATLLTELEKLLIFCDPGNTVNTDYEGDIANAGDTVHIGSLVRPVIKNYVKNSTVITPDGLTINDQTLTVDQSKFFAIEIDDIDKRQALGGGSMLTKAGTEAAKAMAEVIDGYMGLKFVTGAGTVMTPRTVVPTATDATGIYGVLLDLKTKMDKLKLPMANRWVGGDPALFNALYWDSRFTDASKYGSANVVTNGEIGSILGFKIKPTHAAPQGATAAANGKDASHFIVAGAGDQGASYAQQISKTEAYRPESSFSDALKGLTLYGGKVVRPEFVVVQDVLVG